jgi:bifunctional DNase/RNase
MFISWYSSFPVYKGYSKKKYASYYIRHSIIEYLFKNNIVYITTYKHTTYYATFITLQSYKNKLKKRPSSVSQPCSA